MTSPLFARLVGLCGMATLLAAPVLAQSSSPTAGVVVGQSVAAMGSGAHQGPIELLGFEPLDTNQPILNAPYSAEAITETTQTLLDGNRIERRSSTVMMRDGRGRIRREQSGVALGVQVAERAGTLVTITDPSAGTVIMLDAARRMATRTRARQMVFQRGQMSTGGQTTGMTFEAVAPPPSAPGGIGGTATAGARVEWTTATPALGVAFAPFSAAMLEGSAGAQTTETLPAQIIEGVRAEGTKTTTTIPAGAIGNQAPIAIVSERWYSPELQLVLVTRRLDPRVGETVYRVTNLVRAEPPAELFEVPPDFVVMEPGMPTGVGPR